MAKTSIALYRQGNANSPRMDNVRPKKDLDTYEEQGQMWVVPSLEGGRLSGGISTFATPGKGKNWWKLDSGTEIMPELKLVNDRDDHWLWTPSYSMLMDEYKAALGVMGASFYKIS